MSVHEYGVPDAVSQSVITELAAAAREHNVLISISVSPFDQDEDETDPTL